MKRDIALFIFNDVEVMDFAGPFEVFSVTNELQRDRLFNIKIVGRTKDAIIARNALSVNPDCSIDEIEHVDILIIPGGAGTRTLLEDRALIEWVQRIGKHAQHILSVCSGSLILAKSGLLQGLKATTHHQVVEALAALAPDTEIIRNTRFVDNGKVVTSAGISAGIDMSLHMIERLYGKDVVNATAEYMEYVRPDQSRPATFSD